ncbi:MAG: acyltransferase [Calditrichaeota bacterium]|nr:acyltransferase [Calditrichota bacterium]
MTNRIKLITYYVFRHPWIKLRLGKLGESSRLFNCSINGYKKIFIGSKVYIKQGGWLACEPLTGNDDCSLRIGDGTYIGRFCHIYATSGIHIGKKVLIADKVYIADNRHGYEDPNMPVIDQPVQQINEVVIGDGAWLGENVCIVGANVGKNSVVGANSVVMKDIPDYCVAVGSPAHIIKRYSFERKEWLRTNKKGDFI